MKSARPHPAWVPWFFLGPFLLLFAVFFAWPLARAAVLSFEQTYGPGVVVFIGLRNATFLLRDPLFWTAFKNTVIFTVGSLLVQMPAALGLALLLNRPSLKGRHWFRLVFFSPALIGIVFAATLATLVFEKQTGLINYALHSLFHRWDPDFPWLDDYLMTSLILAALWLYAGFNMVYFLAALQNVPAEQIDGTAGHADMTDDTFVAQLLKGLGRAARGHRLVVADALRVVEVDEVEAVNTQPASALGD